MINKINDTLLEFQMRHKNQKHITVTTTQLCSIKLNQSILLL